MNPQWITYPRFLFHRKLHSYENKKRSARIALRRIGRCRFRDPPQAENPALQDSFLAAGQRKKEGGGRIENREQNQFSIV